MAKLALNPSPTFSAVVQIPVAGAAPVGVSFTFKHMMREPFGKLLEELGKGDVPKVEALMKVACGWELDEPFDAEHLQMLCDAYLAAPRAILDKFIEELSEGRVKN